jgi:hypothetical protein
MTYFEVRKVHMKFAPVILFAVHSALATLNDGVFFLLFTKDSWVVVVSTYDTDRHHDTSTRYVFMVFVRRTTDE